MIETIRFAGSNPGVRLLLLGGVHGDEKPGTLALELLATDLREGRIRLLKGQVTFASRVNARAVELGRHCVDENLNRIVRRTQSPATHEQRLANELIPLIEEADAVLDLHGTTAPTRPFAFLDDESSENCAWARALGLDFLLRGWPALYADAKTVTTTECAQSLGKRALTIEVGQNEDPASAALGRAFALRTLAHFGLTAAGTLKETPRELRLTRVVRRERDGAFARGWKNFAAVKKGEILARYADGGEVVAARDAFVIMPFANAAVGEEWLYLADV